VFEHLGPILVRRKPIIRKGIEGKTIHLGKPFHTAYILQTFLYKLLKSSVEYYTNVVYFKISPYIFVSNKQRKISRIEFKFLSFTLKYKGYPNF